MIKREQWLVPAAIFVLAVSSMSLAAADPTPRFALLVGINEYPQLSDAEQLEGSVNDVGLMKTILTTRFDFEESDIVTLTDEAATGEGIRAALDQIASRVSGLSDDSPPAQVVFHFSGHGSQVPDQEGEGRDEENGLDETLVPWDATKQGGESDIRDDELNDFAHRICGGGKAHLWVILDCCHSGTGIRAVNNAATPGPTRFRKIDRDLQPTTGPLPPLTNRLPDGVVALYACRDNELEPEYDDGENKYGLLTRFLAQVINEQEHLEHFTYGLLRDAIAARYQQDRAIAYIAPTPQLEAAPRLIDAPLLGSSGQPRKRYWEVRTDGPAVVLLAGGFHGMTAGSVFEVYPSPDEIEWQESDDLTVPQGNSRGWIKIERVDGATCLANFITWRAGRATPTRPPRGWTSGFAVERWRAQGDFDLRLKVVDSARATVALKPDDPALPEVVRTAVETARHPTENDWLRWIEDDQPADLVLCIDGTQATFFPGAGLPPLASASDEVPAPLRGGWELFELNSPDVVPQLQAALRRVTRARNVLRLASLQSRGGKAGIDVEIELLRVPDRTRMNFVQPWSSTTQDADRYPPMMEMKSGDCYSYRITNREPSGRAVYISVLHINANMGIEQVFPYQDASGIQGLAEAMLSPGQSRIEGPFLCNGGDDTNFGRRTTIVLATREPNHFYMLSQDAFRVVREAGEQASLEKLLLQNAYFRAAPRGRPVSLYDNSWGTAVVEWTVTPDP